MSAFSKVGISLDRTSLLEAATRALMKTEVLVGVPDKDADRKPEPGQKKPPSNATIAYVQEFGDDERKIPPRPFLVPGVESARTEIIGELTAIGIKAMNGATADQVKTSFERIGIFTAKAAQDQITAGGFAPLSERTIRARANRRTDKGKLSKAHPAKEAREYLRLKAEGVPVDLLNDAGYATPLLDTRQLFSSIKYVVKSK